MSCRIKSLEHKHSHTKDGRKEGRMEKRSEMTLRRIGLNMKCRQNEKGNWRLIAGWTEEDSG